MKNYINNLIKFRTTYGVRKETATKRGYKLSWSNASARWNCYYSVNKGEVVELDANQILVYGNKKNIEIVITELDPLPLYKNSYEYNNKAI